MSSAKETQSKPAEEEKEKLAVVLSYFHVITYEPDEFIEKLDQLCQEYSDPTGNYSFKFKFDGY